MHAVTDAVAPDCPAPPRVLRRSEVEAMTGLSRSSLYAHIAAGKFPRPITLSARRVGWLAHEVAAWVQARIAARDGKAAA